ncbi:MAG: hypothetical protein LC662_05900 [Rhodothermaceae bacterium]|nr:hypothetical protein [Rhodothermaceae bacterium]
MNKQHSGNRAGAIPVATRNVILSTILVATHRVILSAIPATHHVILSAIPVYRDVVEERGGMTMPPVFNTRHNTITGGRLRLPTYFDFTPLRCVALNMTSVWFRL